MVTTLPKAQEETNREGVYVTVNFDPATQQWTASDGSTVTATELNAGWKIETSSGFKGYAAQRIARSSELASIQNDKPEGTSTSYASEKGSVVDLLKSPQAKVVFTDTIDDKSPDAQANTITTSLTVVAPDGTQTVFEAAKDEEATYMKHKRQLQIKQN